MFFQLLNPMQRRFRQESRKIADIERIDLTKLPIKCDQSIWFSCQALAVIWN